MNLLRPLVLAVALLPLVAAAQWQWIDKDGRKVFSDRAPPSDIPEHKILKQPRGFTVPTSAPAEPAAAASSAPASAAKAAASAPKLSGKDKELEDKKKKAEAAAAEKKKEEQEKYAKERADNCVRVKQAKATVDSGVRLATTNAKGEREIMDDAARAAETKRLQGIIDRDCK